MKYYTASKSRNQGREAWSVIFRHPTRIDTASNKPGRRVRRGLGTSDDNEATRLVDQLNQILRTKELWESSARTLAQERFDQRIVDIFYDGLEASSTDFTQLRENLIPLPTAAQGYRTVLLVGTTGAGKTTVLRQILGTNPRTERFPSTSASRTTIADTELITTDSGSYRAVVSFVPRDEVIDYLAENVSEAALAAYRNQPDDKIRLRLLDNMNQKFRFSYTLGRGVEVSEGSIIDDDDEETETEIDPDYYGTVDLALTNEIVAQAVQSIKALVEENAQTIVKQIAESDIDDRVVDELIEQALDETLREKDEFHRIVDSFIDEIEKRFALLSVGELQKTRQGWPLTWSWESENREEFVKEVSRFTSNYAPFFGRLLTPVVNGIRVSGPFKPIWATEPVHLVLIDGEGLGHTPKSASVLSTRTSARLQEVDAVLLVDNAKQPMQAAPIAALKSIAISGNARKLYLVFTHLDDVTGDNLPTFADREQHIIGSVENVLKAVGEELNPAAELALRQRVERASFFVGGINKNLNPKKPLGKLSIDQLTKIIHTLAHPESVEMPSGYRPIFNRMNLGLAVYEATKTFHKRWAGLLGIEFNPDAPKEHWTKVKALNRRFAQEWDDHYRDLQPVADLIDALQTQVFLLVNRPEGWQGKIPNQEEKQLILAHLSNELAGRIQEIAARRIGDEVRAGWRQAYDQKGAKSAARRAKIIAREVLEKGAPVPTVAAASGQNSLMKDVAETFADVVRELNGEID